MALGQTADADRVFAELFAHDPHADLSGPASPKLKAALARAKERVYPRDFVRLELRPTAEGSVRIFVLDPWRRVADVSTWFRQANGDPQSLVMVVDDGGFRAVLPDTAVAAKVPYWIEARNARGEVVARLGTADEPLLWTRFAPRATDAGRSSSTPPLVTGGPPRAFIWALVGTAVVTAVVATGLGLSAADDARRARKAEFGSETQELNASARQKAIAANVLGGAALVTGGTAGILWWAW